MYVVYALTDYTFPDVKLKNRASQTNNIKTQNLHVDIRLLCICVVFTMYRTMPCRDTCNIHVLCAPRLLGYTTPA